MSHKREVLSAYLDGEVTPETARKVEARLKDDDEFRRAYDSYRRLEASLQQAEEPDYVDAAERLWRRLESRRLGERPTRPSFWERRVTLPLPAALAAAALFVIAAAAALYLGSGATGSAPQPLAGVDPRELDITIQIDDGQAQELIRWLEERKDVQQVNIQLPDTPSFELIGDPVLMPASEARWPSR